MGAESSPLLRGLNWLLLTSGAGDKSGLDRADGVKPGLKLLPRVRVLTQTLITSRPNG
jgi:hypothetical protein